MLTLQFLTEQVKIEPFDIFFDFGNAVCGDRQTLSIYAEKFYNFYKDRCDSELLREKMVCDMICCGAEKHIPDCLKIKDGFYGKIKKQLSQEFGNDIRFAILYKSDKVFVVRQNEKKDFFGRKKGAYLNLCKH